MFNDALKKAAFSQLMKTMEEKNIKAYICTTKEGQMEILQIDAENENEVLTIGELVVLSKAEFDLLKEYRIKYLLTK